VISICAFSSQSTFILGLYVCCWCCKTSVGVCFFGGRIELCSNKTVECWGVGMWVHYFGDGIVGIMDCEAKCWEDSLLGWWSFGNYLLLGSQLLGGVTTNQLFQLFDDGEFNGESFLFSFLDENIPGVLNELWIVFKLLDAAGCGHWIIISCQRSCKLGDRLPK